MANCGGPLVYLLSHAISITAKQLKASKLLFFVPVYPLKMLDEMYLIDQVMWYKRLWATQNQEHFFILRLCGRMKNDKNLKLNFFD